MNYQDYSVDDLINEESFQSYALGLKKEDVAFWEDCLNKQPNLKENADLAASAIRAIKITPEPVSESIVAEDFQRLSKALNQYSNRKESTSPNWAKWVSGLAASIILAVGLFYLQPYLVNENDELADQVLIEKSNPSGRRSLVTLPDGTKVNLNAASSLQYFERNGKREVFLKGEAFFKVKRDTQKPFTVFSGDLSTTALGTSFNVRAYEDDPITKVYLVTGKVAIESNRKGAKNKQILLPGNGITYDKRINELNTADFSAEDMLGWKEGSLKFVNADFDKVKKELERWYGVKIEVSGQLTNPWEINGSFKNQSIKNVLQSIQYTTDFEYEIEDKLVRINF